MTEMHVSFSTELPFSAEEVFAWHLRQGAIERMIPPSQRVSFLFPPGSPEIEGSKVGLRVHMGPMHFDWLLEHQRVSFLEFSDVQIRGPFKKYTHRHQVIPKGPHACILSEEIHCDLYGYCGWARHYLHTQFSKIFSWRHAILRDDLILFSRYPQLPLRILLSGAHGLVGSHLKILLQTAGHQVINLMRGVPQQRREDAIFWNPSSGDLCKNDFEDFDAVIHLAGENIASQRWTASRKEKIFLSRARDTWLLSQVLCRLYRPPQTVITASAIGFYGDCKDNELDETCVAGKGFLADLCKKWEAATEAIENRGSRVVHARFGMVLSQKKGALSRMLSVFKWGLGGRLGNGEQYISWIGIDDAIGALYHILMDESLAGPVNVVSPSPLLQKEFVHVLAEKIHRPARLVVPAEVLRLFFGEMADEVLLSSTRALPKQLMHTKYLFRYPTLSMALDRV